MSAAKGSPDAAVAEALAWLQRRGTRKGLDAMARYAIVADKAFGVSVANIQVLGKRLGRSHALAAALWETGWYEARMLTAFVDEPERVTAAQMDRWCRQLDNWAVCDTLCFHLFDRTPHAWKKVALWSRRSAELEKRAAFALLWSLTVHDKTSGDEPFLAGLAKIERAAADGRHWVKKAVNMALRAVGKRNRSLHAAALAVARRLADSRDAAPHWIGGDALRELASPAVTRRLAARRK